MKQIDLDFLRNYAAGGGTVLVQNAQGQFARAPSSTIALHQDDTTRVNPYNTVTLQRAGPTVPLAQQPGGGGGIPQGSDTPTLMGGNSPTSAPTQVIDQRARRQQAAQQAQQQRAQQRAQRRAAQAGVAAGLEAVGAQFAGMRGLIRDWSERAATVPTPGGIGMELAILAVLLMAVVPVNEGYTRLQLLWMTFLNQTYIPEAQAVEDARASGQLSGLAPNGQPSSSGGNSGSNGGSTPVIPIPSPIPGVPWLPIPQLPKLPFTASSNGNTGSRSSSVIVPPNGQLPIAGPLPSNGIRSL